MNQESIQAFESGVRNASAFRSIGLFFCLTPESRQYVSQRSAFVNRWCLVLDADDMRRVLTSSDGRSALRDLILDRIPKEQLLPFSTSVPAEGPCFVGRVPELRAMTCGDQDYALCGKGGAGKSSLLRQMRWKLRSSRDDRFSRLVEVELLGITDLREAARRIAVAIDASRIAQDVSVSGLEPFLRRIRSGDRRFHDGPIDLVLDEMDSVLSTDRRSNTKQFDDYGLHYNVSEAEESFPGYPLMQVLRRARAEGLIRLTISGRTETQRMLTDPESPFVVHQSSGKQHVSRLKLLEVGALSPAEAQSMLLDPLRDMNTLKEAQVPEILRRLDLCEGIPFHIADLGLDIFASLS